MASISRRGKGWSVIWRESGTQHRRTFPTRDEALTFKAETEAGVRRGRRTVSARTTFGAWWATYTEQRMNVRESTRLRAQEVYRAHLTRWEDVPLADLTHAGLQAWVAGLDRAPATVKKIVTELRLALDAAVRAGLLTANPAVGLVLPKQRKADMTIVEPAVLGQLADAVPDRYRALVLTMGYAGLRVGEAIALEPADVRDGYIRVNKSMTKTEQGYALGEPKSSAGYRQVPMPQHLVDTLNEHMQKYPGRYLFTGRQGARVQAHNFSQRAWATACKNVGVDMRVHDLRHTAITYWVQAGVPLPQVVKWAGHSDASFTLNRYAHYMPKDDARWMELLSAYTNA